MIDVLIFIKINPQSMITVLMMIIAIAMTKKILTSRKIIMI